MSRGKMEGMDIIHPMRRFRCFVFDLQLKLRSSRPSKPKRKIRLCYYVCVRPAFTLWAVEPLALPPLASPSSSLQGIAQTSLALLLLRASVQQG